jgi:hypothetical protein
MGIGEVYEVEMLIIKDKVASFGTIQTVVWTPNPPYPTEVDLYWACWNISRSGSMVTSVSNVATDIGADNNGGSEPKSMVVVCKPKRKGGDRKEDFYWPRILCLGSSCVGEVREEVLGMTRSSD